MESPESPLNESLLSCLVRLGVITHGARLNDEGSGDKWELPLPEIEFWNNHGADVRGLQKMDSHREHLMFNLRELERKLDAACPQASSKIVSSHGFPPPADDSEALTLEYKLHLMEEMADKMFERIGLKFDFMVQEVAQEREKVRGEERGRDEKKGSSCGTKRKKY